MLVSANALRRRDNTGWRSAPDLDGLDVALDSAGYVAMSRYGGQYRWTVEEYVALAASRDWAWWASMDFCCEPQIAQDQAEIERRQDLTWTYLGLCDAEAERAGIKPPMPVLQGWTVADYLRHVATFPRAEWPALVGVGSMCRRRLTGPNGLVAVVDALDRVLPPHVRLHLFGVKSAGLTSLGKHPRLESVDSCAWDFEARATKDVSCTMAHRAATMARWNQRQERRIAQAHGHQWRLL